MISPCQEGESSPDALFLVTTVATSVTGFLFRSTAFAIPWGRHRIVDSAGSRGPGALRLSPRRRLAPDLCGQRRDCPLSEWLCLDGEGVHEGVGGENDEE